MGIQFGTDEWVKALMEALNESEKYAKAAAKWEGDFYFIIEEGDGFAEETYLYMDLQHGKCLEAFKVDDPATKSPAFSLSAPESIWRGVLDGKIDPISAIMTRKFKLTGSKMKILKSPKAATALVEVAGELDTDWP